MKSTTQSESATSSAFTPFIVCREVSPAPPLLPPICRRSRVRPCPRRRRSEGFGETQKGGPGHKFQITHPTFFVVQYPQIGLFVGMLLPRHSFFLCSSVIARSILPRTAATARPSFRPPRPIGPAFLSSSTKRECPRLALPSRRSSPGDASPAEVFLLVQQYTYGLPGGK